VKDLFFAKTGNSLESEDMMSFDEVNAKIWDVNADVFLPCAGSRLVNQDQVDRLLAAGVSVISSGANVPFADKEILYGPIAESVDKRIAVIPDFIANCGMARVFAYLMSDGEVNMSDEAIFNDTSEIIRKALLSTCKLRSEKTLLSATAFEKALKTLSN
jgi:glutamate dehydrogenase/leucine dehydrogenase